MTRSLDGSVLHLFGDLRAKHAAWFRLIREVGVMPCIALNADFPALFGHSENKCPPVFGVQVGVGEHQKTLILIQQYVLLEVLEDLPGVILLDFRVSANPGRNQSLPLQFIQTLQGISVVWILARLDFDDLDASEENLRHRLHIIQQHLLESPLILGGLFVDLLGVIPHFEDDNLVNIPVFTLIFELVEALGFLLLVFGNPVAIGYREKIRVKICDSLILTLALLCQKIGLNCSISVFNVLYLLFNRDFVVPLEQRIPFSLLLLIFTGLFSA